MARFTIQAPDGRKIKIEAADEATAIRGAQEWAAANPKPVQFKGSVPKMQGGVTPSTNVEVREPSAQYTYDKRLADIRKTYYPGMSDEQWDAAVKQTFAPHNAGDLLKGSMVMGLGDELAGAAAAVGGPLMSGHFDLGKTYQDFQGLEQARRELGREQQGGLGVAADIGGALLSGRPDMAATRVAGFLPNVVRGATDAAKQGALYGFASTEGGLHERAEGALKGAGVASIFGAAVPAAAGVGRRIMSPIQAPAAKTHAANVLRQEGVELTAGQATGNKGLLYREAELGGGAAENFMERQADQFTNAALRRVGVNANRATPDVIDAAFTDIGQMFDDLAARNGLQTDARFVQDLQAAWRDFDNVTNASTRPPFVERILGDVAQRMRTGYAFLDGNWFKSTRSELNRVMRSTSNPEMKEALQGILAAFDGAMERTLQQVNPADLGAWREARRLYRNMFVIEDAATRAGEKAAEGIITPQALRGAAMRQNKRAFARGQNEFTDLANAGVSTMTPLPNSGTPGRLNAKLVLPAGAAAGATIGSVAGPVGTAIGAGVGALTPWALGRAMLSGPGRAYLGNQVAGPVTGLSSLLGGSVGRGIQPLLSR